ncbi:hypothetical protein [Rhodospirillum rubrum]|uniref:hypothetical protein n=1 Tax=Rhodospirillum rubrum TaxID=1085 RepID=UPI0019058E40|nr:hypothetical protein [Rhodospirillum rubrum]
MVDNPALVDSMKRKRRIQGEGREKCALIGRLKRHGWVAMDKTKFNLGLSTASA